LTGAKPSDVVIIGDVDEVVRPAVLARVLGCAEVAFPVSLLLADHNYNLHWRKRDPSFLSLSLVSLARLASPVVLRRVLVGQGLASGETNLISQVRGQGGLYNLGEVRFGIIPLCEGSMCILNFSIYLSFKINITNITYV
jgi:hypothetical protein